MFTVIYDLRTYSNAMLAMRISSFQKKEDFHARLKHFGLTRWNHLCEFQIYFGEWHLPWDVISVTTPGKLLLSKSCNDSFLNFVHNPLLSFNYIPTSFSGVLLFLRRNSSSLTLFLMNSFLNLLLISNRLDLCSWRPGPLVGFPNLLSLFWNPLFHFNALWVPTFYCRQDFQTA